MNSSRFRGKPLAKILGMPMIGHCYLRSKMCLELANLCVATCDKDLRRRIRKIPGVPIMYISQHKYTIERMVEAFGAPRSG